MFDGFPFSSDTGSDNECLRLLEKSISKPPLRTISALLSATLKGISTDYIAAGGNQNPAAADWDTITGLLAYGSDRNVALWDPLNKQQRGVFALLRGHTDDVTAVKFFHSATGWPCLILSGSIDKTIRFWQADPAFANGFNAVCSLEGHESSVNCLAVLHGRQVLVSGAADATIKVWKVRFVDARWETFLLQSIQTHPKYLPLTLALSALEGEDLLVAAAGTKPSIYVYAVNKGGIFAHQLTLGGHEGWIRSLDITRQDGQGDGDLLLASASQDKYIRLWRLHRDQHAPIYEKELSGEHFDLESLLSNKTYRVLSGSESFTLTFEALLLGHDDWIYTVAWKRDAGKLRLLSASADNSLAMWDTDAETGIWVCTTRLGEISAEKGSTTATGSMGGFWAALWSSDGQSIVGLGRNGSWRLWNYNRDHQRWVQGVGISGHSKSIMDIAWAPNGSYLLSTGSDQTTRLHAEWIDRLGLSWHEMARPQIHGYNLNCIDTIGELQFVSGADEKLLRVFDEPKRTAERLRRLCGIKNIHEKELPPAANVPVLGLSNKAVDEKAGIPLDQLTSPVENIPSPAADLSDPAIEESELPPSEDELAKHTLWPEREKLYGHGYEICALAASHDGSVIATACRASSLDHAVIRLFESKNWRELKPPLTAHSLTVTCLRFSSNDQFLLSTGRDRQWAVFQRDETGCSMYQLRAANKKAHSRMILSACWAPMSAGTLFITAGRDKMCKIWDLERTEKEAMASIAASTPVTAVDILPWLAEGMLVVAAATEDGGVTIHLVGKSPLAVQASHRFDPL
ncbi:MAG: hypothetical protein Q9219_005958 [cf. Caloplaca sp. 3 TL-2023]